MGDEPDMPEITVADERTGKPFDGSVLEEHDVAFDPGRMHLDLTKEEKRHTTALMLAIQAYKNLIIDDAAYLKEAADLARRGELKLNPASIDSMVEAAFKFDRFIATGKAGSAGETDTRGGMKTEDQGGNRDPVDEA